MKVILILIIIMTTTWCCWAQDVVEWKYSTKKISDSGFEVHFTPKLSMGWHIYALNPSEDSAFPTVFSFEENQGVIFEGKVKEILPQKDFIQIVRLKERKHLNIRGTIEYVACNDERCMPPKTIKFNIDLK